MINLTKNEREVILILFKDFTSYYNANSISKRLSITRVGAMKILRKLRKGDILVDKKISKSIIYKLNLEDGYVRDLVVFLLADEANKFKRWKDEFKKLFKKGRVVMLYGSTIKDYSKSRDIDLMIIRKRGGSGEIRELIAERQKFVSKKIHAIDLDSEEFLKNIKQRQKAIVEIIKDAIILFGQNKYTELIKNVTSI